MTRHIIPMHKELEKTKKELEKTKQKLEKAEKQVMFVFMLVTNIVS